MKSLSIKRYFLFISMLFCTAFVNGQGKIYPAIGFEFNQAHNIYGDIFKFKRPELNTNIRSGGGINIGVAYTKNFRSYPYFKSGILFHGGMKKDSLYENTNSYYKSHYILFPTYLGFQYWGFVGFSIEIGADYVLGYHTFTGFDKYRTHKYTFGWNAQITISLGKGLSQKIGFGIGQKYHTKFLHAGIFFPIPFKNSKSQ